MRRRGSGRGGSGTRPRPGRSRSAPSRAAAARRGRPARHRYRARGRAPRPRLSRTRDRRGPRGARPTATPAAAGRSGTRSAPARCRGSARPGVVALLGEHPDGLLDEERVALRLVQERLPQAPRQRRVRDERVDERRCPPLRERPQVDRDRAASASSPPGSRSRSSGRARQTISTGASSTLSARCSMRSRSGSSAQWTSSKPSTSGCASASDVAHSCAAQAISCPRRLPETVSSTPEASPSKSATASLEQASLSFSNASSGESSGEIPAASWTISASGL